MCDLHVWLQVMGPMPRPKQMRTIKHNAGLMVFAKKPCLPIYLPGCASTVE